MLISPEGYDAFLYVGKYGSRFTDEDVRVFNFLAEIFGPDFAKQMCILILTCGDNFKDDHEEDGLTFEGWCRKERGNFRTLMMECGNRILLFNNNTKDKIEKTEQVDKLLFYVKKLKESNQNERYTDVNFEKAKALRSKRTDKQQDSLRNVSLLLQKLREMEGKYAQDKLLMLSSDCAQILLSIQEQNEETAFTNEIQQKLVELERLLHYCCHLYSHNSEKISGNEEALKEVRDAEEKIDDKIVEVDAIYQKHRRNFLENLLLSVGFVWSRVVTAGAAGVAALGGAVSGVLGSFISTRASEEGPR